MINSKLAIFLGLSEQEKKILNLLIGKNSGLTATDIAPKVSEPRTTVNFHLQKLLKKGWVIKTKKRGFPYPLWSLSDKDSIKSFAMNFFAQFGISSSVLPTSSPEEGYEQIISAYEKVLGAEKEERIFAIQGSRAPAVVMEKLPGELIEKIHYVQKQKPIIIEGITSIKALSVFYNMTEKELSSHFGRLTVAYLLPDEFLDFDEEIYVFQKSVVIIQPIAGKSLVIKDESISRVFKMLIKIMEQNAKRLDINALIRELIEKMPNKKEINP